MRSDSQADSSSDILDLDKLPSKTQHTMQYHVLGINYIISVCVYILVTCTCNSITCMSTLPVDVHVY